MTRKSLCHHLYLFFFSWAYASPRIVFWSRQNFSTSRVSVSNILRVMLCSSSYFHLCWLSIYDSPMVMLCSSLHFGSCRLSVASLPRVLLCSGPHFLTHWGSHCGPAHAPRPFPHFYFCQTLDCFLCSHHFMSSYFTFRCLLVISGSLSWHYILLTDLLAGF